MQKMEIYIIIYQKILKKLLGNIKLIHFIGFHKGKLLLKKPYTQKSDIYSFGMIMWEHTTGKKPFHDRPHDQYLMLDILKGERPQITDDTPKFYAELMKR